MGSANNTVGAIFPYAGKGTAALNVSSGQNLRTEKEKSGFESIFNMVSDASSQKNTIAREVKGKDLETAGTKIDTARQNKRPEIVETEGKEANKELQNAISEDGKKLIKQIAEETDLSEEEIVSVMEMLGFNASDLLKPENMIQLFNQLSSEEDGLNIILNPELSDSLNKLLESVNEIRNDLFEEFNIAPEELNSYIESFEEMTDAVTTMSKLPIKQSMEIPTEKEETDTSDISELSEEKILKTTDHPKTTKEPETINENNPEVIFKPVEESQQKGSNTSEHTNLFNQLINNLSENQVKVPETENIISYTDRARMEDIVRQIADKITITAGETESSMELQLHPASLGNVNILLTSSKDGIVAKFTAQNEIVKEAVESQMVQLQQKFDEQGIKVTSIEVTIASHAFEQNLHQDNNERQDNNEAQRGGRGLRRINLAEFDPEEENEMSEAEMIAAQMMAYNGNSIDFSA